MFMQVCVSLIYVDASVYKCSISPCKCLQVEYMSTQGCVSAVYVGASVYKCSISPCKCSICPHKCV